MAALSKRASFAFAGHMSWFPGHMAKATRIIESKVRAADVVVEVRDARVSGEFPFARSAAARSPPGSAPQIPFSSQNFAMESILSRKPRVIVFNKAELADPAANARVKAAVATPRTDVLFTTATSRNSIKSVRHMHLRSCDVRNSPVHSTVRVRVSSSSPK